MEKKQFFNLLRDYNNNEEQLFNNFLRPEKIQRENIADIDIDKLFGPNLVNEVKHITKQYDTDGKERIYWRNNQYEIKRTLEASITPKDFEIICSTMEIIRGKYLMNCNYSTIEPEYQEMIQLYISLLLKRHVLGIENYFQYFDPNSAYYKRIKTLTLFRFLKHPKEEIEKLLPHVAKNLRESVEVEPESLEKAENIFKEYFERIFSLTRTDKHSRVGLLGLSDENLQYFYEKTDLERWLVDKVEGDENSKTVIDSEEKKEEKSEQSHYVEEKNQDFSVIKSLQDQVSVLLGDVQILKQQTEYNTQLIEENKKLKEKTRDLESLYDVKNEEISQLDQTLQEKNEELQKKDELIKIYIQRIKELENIDTTKTVISKNSLSKEEILEKRKYYKVIIVGGSEKANKSYKNFIKDDEYQKRFKLETGLDLQQFELCGDFGKQQDRNFTKSLQDKLELGNTDFLIAIHTDHNTPFANLIENPEFNQRITVIGEREDNNENPKYGQGVSMDSLIYYTKRACEKYERFNVNSNV